MPESIEIFLCYAREDDTLRQGLEKHLRVLRRQGIVDLWRDRDISAGMEWKQAIDNHLNAARIILLLVSPDFLDSDYCYSVEMQRAMERHEREEACVIPIILRYVYWEETPFGKLQALLTDGKPILSKHWFNEDEALYTAVEGIRAVVKEMVAKDKVKQYVEEGYRFYEEKQYSDAIKAFNQALQYDPKNFQALYNKGSIFAMLQEYESALEAFDQSVLIKPKDVRALKNQGSVLYALKRHKDALNVFINAEQINSDDEDIKITINTLREIVTNSSKSKLIDEKIGAIQLSSRQ